MLDQYVKEILTAQVYEVARESALNPARILSDKLGRTVLLKREDTQPVFSFKLRGAFNKIASLSPEERARGVVAASAGNHAQGVALAARTLKCQATIVMPRTTPSIKVEAVRRLGAKAEQHGNNYDEASAYAQQFCASQGMVYVPPYDDPKVIAGQGTVAVEILRQHPKAIEAVFIPVGGGGLVAGMAAYIKYLRPDIKVIGVEPVDAACLQAAMVAGKPVELSEVGLFADGVAVKQIGTEPFRIAKDHVDEVITVDTDEICAAVRDVFLDTRSVAEPAGALAVAGIKKYLARQSAETTQHNNTKGALVAVVSGANVNFDRLRHIAERAELGDEREALLAVTIPEQPGAFKAFCHALGNRGISEFNYRYSESGQAHIFVGVHLRDGQAECQELVQSLEADGYPVVNFTGDELAKIHIRHLVGGRSHLVNNERLYRVQFPERPGALRLFLSVLGNDWNISLFHYRNHGADFGRVLMGLQVPPGQSQAVKNALADIGYPNWEETDNPAYRLFLG